MPCIEIKTKKYQTRKSPAYHAKDCKGLTKKGNDGKYYISTPDKKGIYKWIIKSNNITLKKKGVQTYKILDNGSEPFAVDVFSNHIEVYKQLYNNNNSYTRDKKILVTPFKKIFIGDNNLKDKAAARKGMYPGNSILICTGKGKYIYIGNKIYSFETRDNEDIKEYYSPVGNSVVPYPYAVGENYTYFMLDEETISNELLNLKQDAYGQFYGHTIKDETLKRDIESSKNKFKHKIIHKQIFS